MRTKTKSSDDTVVIDHQSFSRVGAIFRCLVLDARLNNAATLSFRLDYPAYAKHISQAATQIGIPFKVTPHLARHGGASEDFARRKRTLDEIMKRGRWRDKRSVVRYEKSGMLLISVACMFREPLPARPEPQTRL